MTISELRLSNPKLANISIKQIDSIVSDLKHCASDNRFDVVVVDLENFSSKPVSHQTYKLNFAGDSQYIQVFGSDRASVMKDLAKKI